jgi:transcription termination factor NusB
LAKEFSGEKSHVFINGILNNIVGQLRRENKIFKSTR